MKRIHVLRTHAGAEEVAGLVAAVRAEGLRVGWLDLTLEVPPAALAGLDQAARAGAARSVALASGRSVAVKQTVGPPVLRDVLREHFVGCALVLVRDVGDDERGDDERGGDERGGDERGGDAGSVLDVTGLPRLEAAGEGWRVTSPAGETLALETAALAARLRRPEPWPGALRTDRRH